MHNGMKIKFLGVNFCGLSFFNVHGDAYLKICLYALQIKTMFQKLSMISIEENAREYIYPHKISLNEF